MTNLPDQINFAEQSAFLDAVRLSLEEGDFKRVVFSSHHKGEDKFKASFDLVVGETKRLIRATNNKAGAETTGALDIDALLEQMGQAPISPFRNATLYTAAHDFHYAENRKMEPRLYKSKASMKDAVQTHNKPKQYTLSEDRPYLKSLGVSSDAGKVNKQYYPKFRQIANFVEIIDRDIGDFVTQTERPISILDLGCGKGYLTFATYDYVKSRAKHQPKASGIDIKADVIKLCNEIANRLGFSGLEFRNARIQPNKTEPIDILIALHACDTATDDALALGLRSQMKYLFCAPCCQAEIARQIDVNQSAFDPINQFALMKRRQSDIVTDICRALLLNTLGYEVKFMEFTPLEHTAKNLMLVGKQSDSVDRAKAWHDYLDLKRSYGFGKHSLEENIRDLLPMA